MNIKRKSEPLRQALALLSKAISPTARVQRLDHTAPGQEGAMIHVDGGRGKSANLLLSLWDKGTPGARAPNHIWVLRRTTQELRQRLRERDENFVDLGGAVRLRLPWLMIDRSDLDPVRIKTKDETRNPFSDRGSLVLRTMWDAGVDKTWNTRELADASGVSLGLVSYVTSALQQRQLVDVQAAGRARRIQLTDLMGIIEQWTREYDWKSNTDVAFHAPVGSTQRFLRRLPKAFENRRWALTLQAGAALVAPHATWEQVHVYADAQDADALHEIGHAAGWEAGEGGKVVLMVPFYKDSVWHGCRRIKGLPVVSNLQLILDLRYYPVRGREQAEHLLSTTLGVDH